MYNKIQDNSDNVHLNKRGHYAEDGGIIISYKFYKWIMIIDLVAIGVLRFLAGTFFEYTTVVRIIDAALYVIAIIALVVYLRKRIKVSNAEK